ncbi:MAG: hypothetical protein ACPG4X_15525 [Pikeienuella sp.]
MLAIRMLLYAVFAAMANEGLLLFDADAGTVTLKIEDIMLFGAGVVGYIGTFVTSRYAKARGGAT